MGFQHGDNQKFGYVWWVPKGLGSSDVKWSASLRLRMTCIFWTWSGSVLDNFKPKNIWGTPRTIGADRHAPRSPCASWLQRCGRLPRSTSHCAWEASQGPPGNAQQTCRSHSSGGTWSSCRSHIQSWGKGWNPWIVCAHDHQCLLACARLGSCAWSDRPGSGWTSSFASSQSFSCQLESAWLPWKWPQKEKKNYTALPEVIVITSHNSSLGRKPTGREVWSSNQCVQEAGGLCGWNRLWAGDVSYMNQFAAFSAPPGVW